MKLQEYKGYEIWVSETTGLFELRKYFDDTGGRTYRVEASKKETLKKALEFIDNKVKSEGKRIKVLTLEGGTIIEGVITSLVDGNHYARVSKEYPPDKYNPKGRSTNEQVYLSSCIQDTPENRVVLAELVELEKDRQERMNKVHKLTHALTLVTAKQILEG